MVHSESLDVKNIVPRDDIPTQLIEIPDYLYKFGWGSFSIKIKDSEKPKIFIKASLKKVKKHPLFLYEVGYFESSFLEESVLKTARKLVELCLRINDTFIETLPSTTVDRDGFIRSDMEMSKASSRGVDEMMAFLEKRNHNRKEYEENSLNYSHGYFSLHWDAQDLIITHSVLEKLKEGALDVNNHK